MADPSELIDEVLAGSSLRVVMTPDPEFGRNHPEHDETLDLPHILIRGDVLWAKSETVHLLHEFGVVAGEVHGWCYCNQGKYFASFAPSTSMLHVMAKRRYKSHRWRVRRDYRLVWDSQGPTTAEPVRDGIDAGARFRVAMLDSEGVWNVHPVDLPCYIPEDGTFQLKTATDNYPLEFRSVPDMKKMTDAIDGEIGEEWERIYNVPVTLFRAFYSLFSDGTYYN